jgi:hypothetical protein
MSFENSNSNFFLDPQLKYAVFIHDPTFFIIAFKPVPTPGIRFQMDEGFIFISLYLSVTKHIKMNQKTNPCNEDPNYDFQLCVRNSLSRKVGCRLPWDLRSSSNIPLCLEMNQIKTFEKLIFEMSYGGSLEAITKKTGCISPCKFKEYKFALDPDRFDMKLNFTLLEVDFADDKVIIEKEVEGYSFISLVSDIGGALGLFLGFSFVMVWDGVEEIIKKIGKYLIKR